MWLELGADRCPGASMIDESSYWKRDLLNEARSLEKRKRQKRWPDAALARCEQTVMLGFYSIRKLVESGKLTDRTANHSVRVQSYSSNGNTVHFMNRHRIEEIYEMETPEARSVPLLFLCNQVIHSYTCILLLGPDAGLHGILVTSDRQRSNELLQVDVDDIVDVFRRVGNDEVVSMEGSRPSKGDWVFKRA